MTQQPSTSPTRLPRISSPSVESVPLQFAHRWSCVKLGQALSPSVHLQKNSAFPQASILPLTSMHVASGTGQLIISTGLLRKRKYDFSKMYEHLSESVRKTETRCPAPEVSPFLPPGPASNAADHSISIGEGNDYTFSSPSSTTSVSPIICRICLESTTPEDFISPCLCKGSQQWVHEQCLKLWLIKSEKDEKDLTSCEVCKSPFHMNFYYSLTFAPCGSGPSRRCVWIPFGLVLLLLLGVGLLFCVSNEKEKRQSVTVVVLSVLLSSAAVLCAIMGIYLAKELWFVRTIEEWQIENLSPAPN